MTAREPLLKPVPISELRPTQITVGMREVREKRKRFADLAMKEAGTFLGKHMAPIVLGPKHRHYIIDHHHLARALHEDKVEALLVNVVADLSSLSKSSFWTFLDMRGWCHPYDAEGVRKDFSEIPASVDELVDDPYRSLAGELRYSGGYAKDTTPFSEFLWADFLRKHIKRKAIESDFEEALSKALKLAKSPEAAFLPGWAGAHARD